MVHPGQAAVTGRLDVFAATHHIFAAIHSRQGFGTATLLSQYTIAAAEVPERMSGARPT
jgi:hypothetical protein